MKRMQAWRWLSSAVLLMATGVATGQNITAFKNGYLTFENADTNLYYRIEFKPNLAGQDQWISQLPCNINSTNAEETVPVGVFYRVVGTAGAVVDPEVQSFRNLGYRLPEGMVLIPGGTNSGTDPDFGAYSLTVDTFYMDQYEVTKAKWDEVYNWAITNGYSFDNAGSGKAANHPVHSVSWYDCVKWCNARSEKAGLTPAYYTDVGMTQVYKTGQISEPYVKTSANGYRLPTDVQWEYAARGGVANRRFPWGDTDYIDHGRANYCSYWSGGAPYYTYDKAVTDGYHPAYNDGTNPYTSPVGSFAANGYGLHDMTGNVCEWCYDWYPGYEGSRRVGRGGSWSYFVNYCRVGSRIYFWPDYADYDFGFRAVLSPGQP